MGEGMVERGEFARQLVSQGSLITQPVRSGERVFRFGKLGQAPQAAPDAAVRAFFQQHFAGVQQHQHTGAAFRHRFPGSRGGQFALASLHIGDAVVAERTAFALRTAAFADGGAEIHQTLRVGLNVSTRQQTLGKRPELVFHRLFTWPAVYAEDSRQHPLDIAVEDGAPFAEGKSGNRGGGGAADAGQRENRVDVARKVSAMLIDDLPCRRMQVTRPAVIAKA